MDTKFDKLKALITHDGTPAFERAAALDRLIHLIEQGGGPITRSVRIGSRRRRGNVDEWVRLEDYAGGRTYGETLASIHKVCKACNVLPVGIDLGFHGSDEAVIAIKFMADHLPNGLDMQDALRLDWPKARVSATSEQGEIERTYLLYLGVTAETADAA